MASAVDLFGERRIDHLVEESLAIIDEALRLHPASHLFGMLSGGHDSMVANHIASRHPAFSGSAHINTTIGVPQTREYARSQAAFYGWKFKEYLPPVPYREIVLKEGFPGPGAHKFMYIRLKERCIMQLVREHKTHWKDRIGLVTGVRLAESVRRMGNVEAISRVGAQLWIAPIINWTEDDKNDYMMINQIRRNPVVDTLCMSAECLCGAFARREEMVDLEHNYPDVAAEIHALEADAEAAGVHCKWGERPPGKRGATMGGMLCSSCNQRNFDFMKSLPQTEGDA